MSANDDYVDLALPKLKFELATCGFIFIIVYHSFLLFMEDRSLLFLLVTSTLNVGFGPTTQIKT